VPPIVEQPTAPATTEQFSGRIAPKRSVSDGFCRTLIILVMLSSAYSFGEEVHIALEQLQTEHRITGALANLDMSAGRGMLLTDLGKPVFFRVGQPEFFAHVSIGDRITVQLDEEGRAVKVIEALPAEIHEPPPDPQ